MDDSWKINMNVEIWQGVFNLLYLTKAKKASSATENNDEGQMLKFERRHV